MDPQKRRPSAVDLWQPDGQPRGGGRTDEHFLGRRRADHRSRRNRTAHGVGQTGAWSPPDSSPPASSPPDSSPPDFQARHNPRNREDRWGGLCALRILKREAFVVPENVFRWEHRQAILFLESLL